MKLLTYSFATLLLALSFTAPVALAEECSSGCDKCACEEKCKCGGEKDKHSCDDCSCEDKKCSCGEKGEKK